MRRLVWSILACLFCSPAIATATPGAEPACAPAPAGPPRVREVELAGVPAIIRVPARIASPPVVLWHGFGPPASEEALMDLLPLDEVPAVKVYLGLPLFGKRAPADPAELARRQAEDLATGVFEPVVLGAGRELPGIAGAMRELGCLAPGQGIAVFGFSAGGAAALYALAQREVPVSAAVVLNTSTGLGASVGAYERATRTRFAWTPEARALARVSDATRRAAEIAQGEPPPALLIVHGAADTMLDDAGVRQLHRALAPHYTGRNVERLQLEVVPDLAHAIRSADDISAVRGLVGSWFLRFAGDATEAAPRTTTGPGGLAQHGT